MTFIVLQFELKAGAALSRIQKTIEKGRSFAADPNITVLSLLNPKYLPKNFSLLNCSEDDSEMLKHNFERKVKGKERVHTGKWIACNKFDFSADFSMILTEDSRELMRYYSYLKSYEKLLYGWGLYPQSNEFAKLAHNILPSRKRSSQGIKPPFSYSLETFTQKIVELDKRGTRVMPETDIVVLGRLSGKQTKTLLKCSVCDQLVKGLRIYCNHCGHGGHPVHLSKWFQKHELCPAGCGCCCAKYNIF